MSRCAPIVVFAFNRPEHTRNTLSALAENILAADSDLTVYCDGPRTREEEATTQEVRNISRAARGFRSVRVVERPANFGLARSVITGIDEALAANDRVIVVEDDLVTTPHFLSFLNAGLDVYATNDRVISVCGYSFPVRGELPESFFLPGAFCWGWGTWKRGWQLFDRDAARVFDRLLERDLIYEFDFEGSDPLMRALQRTVNKDPRADSWATRWMAAACLHSMVSLYPGRSLVANIGFDGSGRHANHDERFATPLASGCPGVGRGQVELRRDVLRRHRALFVSWRARKPAEKLYFALTNLFPRPLAKWLYSAVLRRSLRRYGWKPKR
jgi:hypothetical protein